MISPNQTLTLSRCRSQRAGSAGGVLQTGQRIGSAAGIAVTGSVFYCELAARTATSRRRSATAWSCIVAFVAAALALAARRRADGEPGRLRVLPHRPAPRQPTPTATAASSAAAP